jgi:hypothetical protein
MLKILIMLYDFMHVLNSIRKQLTKNDYYIYYNLILVRSEIKS